MKNRFNLFIVCLVGFLSNAGIGLVYPIFAVLLFDPTNEIVPVTTSTAERGVLFGLLIALTPFLHFFSATILGTLSDKHGRKTILQYSIGIGIMGYVIAVLGLFTSNLILLFVYRGFIGIADGAAAVAQAAISDISSEDNKARHFSLYNAALGIGFTVGPFMGGIFADPTMGSWCCYTTPFLVTGTLLFINWILITTHFPESLQNYCTPKKLNFFEGIHNLKKAILLKEQRILFFAVFAFCFGWSFFAEFIPLTLIDKFSFSTSQVGQYFAYLGLWYALSTGFLTAPLLKRFSTRELLIKALLVGSIYMPLFLLIENPNYIMLFTPVLMFLIAIIYPTMVTVVSNSVDKQNQGVVLGVYQSIFALALTLSPLIGGFIVTAYPSMTIWGGAVFIFISFFAFWRHLKKRL